MLPFFPEPRPEDIKRADELRNGNAYKIVGQNTPKYTIASAPFYYKDKEGQLDLTKPLVEGRYDDGRNGTGASCDLLEADTLTGLADDQYTNEAIMTSFSYLFNFRELSKKKKDPTYKTVHMFTTHMVDKLSFIGGEFDISFLYYCRACCIINVCFL